PPPVQRPRIPVWVVAAWPRPISMHRALRWDGLLPNKMMPDGTMGEVTPDDVAAMRDYVTEHRTATTPFDIVMEGETPGGDAEAARARIEPFATAGATWWMESMWSAPADAELYRARIRQGPPRID
ncbi:MAG TPA: LLM class flavin-dependent oxidoreductase, partial [Chloroflexia bacterium]|nr:LLM class flavin-dependent oxidoreductase [Chloroflexia bacterium]